MDIDYARALEIIGPSEGNEPHIYLDTNGFPTVGIGNLLKTSDVAEALPFVVRETGEPAGTDAIRADWEAVRAAKSGLRARAYKKLTACDLPDDEILSLFQRRVDEFVKQLTKYFPEFPQFPGGPQLGALDIVFNVGIGGFMKFTHLCAALRAQDWDAAAAACHRHASSDARNESTRLLFLEGASS